MALSERVYVCHNLKCNDYLKTKDRDVNAATNILFWGMAATDSELFAVNTGGTSEINACGESTCCQDVDGNKSSIMQEV